MCKAAQPEGAQDETEKRATHEKGTQTKRLLDFWVDSWWERKEMNVNRVTRDAGGPERVGSIVWGAALVLRWQWCRVDSRACAGAPMRRLRAQRARIPYSLTFQIFRLATWDRQAVKRQVLWYRIPASWCPKSSFIGEQHAGCSSAAKDHFVRSNLYYN
ncbi:hypothetical protein BC826DRAFT_970539 [Russula brevipes]|nr:hypothetical protein BC826DRAFT_970539 [Russula brevipes]